MASKKNSNDQKFDVNFQKFVIDGQEMSFEEYSKWLLGIFGIDDPNTLKFNETSQAKSTKQEPKQSKDTATKKSNTKTASTAKTSKKPSEKKSKKNIFGMTEEEAKSTREFFDTFFGGSFESSPSATTPIQKSKTETAKKVEKVSSQATQKTSNKPSQNKSAGVSKTYQKSTPFSKVLNCSQNSKSDVGAFNFTFGETAQKPEVFDISSFPHIVIEGRSGSGKSAIVKMILLSLMKNYSQEELNLTILEEKLYDSQGEYKEYSEFLDLPHVILANVLNLSGWALNQLSFIDTELENRKQMFLEANVGDFNEFNSRARENGEQILPYLVAVIDEFNLSEKLTEARKQKELVNKILTEAKGFGISLIIVSQSVSYNGCFDVLSLKSNAMIISCDSDLVERFDLLGDSNGDFRQVFCQKPKKHEAVILQTAELKNEDALKEINSLSQVYGAPSVKLSSIKKGEIAKLYGDVLEYAISRKFLSASMLRSEKGVSYIESKRAIEIFEKLGVIAPSIEYRPHDTLITEKQLKELLKNK